MNKISKIFIALFCVGVSLTFAQEPRIRREDVGKLPKKGTVVATVTPLIPYTFSDFVQHADLIIEGNVNSILPSRYLGTGTSVETDMEISIKRVIKGSKDKAVDKVIIAQYGGQIEDFQILVPEDPLMELGGNYLLFLVRDKREGLPDYEHPRYGVAGIYNGKFKINDGKVEPSEKATGYLKGYAGKTVDEFVGEILEPDSSSSATTHTGQQPRRR